MALLSLNQFLRIAKSKNTVHATTKSAYTVFKDTNGKRYFQIDTYGSASREHPEKISQSIQLDEETAKYLIDLLKKEFLV